MAALSCVLSLAPVGALAASASNLASFEGIEEPTVRYYPAQREFRPDAFVNIRDEEPGTIRMELRVRPDWWDGDRDTQNRDRQRAEVKGLGPHQKDGQVFEYGTTWRVDPDYRTTGRFCHIFQLKATDGDDGAPAVTMSLHPAGRVTVQWTPGHAHTTVAREFGFKPGQWETVRIRIKISEHGDGAILVSVDGDAFSGVRGVSVYRTDSTDYRPKWGMYRRVSQEMQLHDDSIEHRDVLARRLSNLDVSGSETEEDLAGQRVVAIESEASARVASDPAAAMDWALAQSDAEARRGALFRVCDRWSSRDSAAAESWLRSHAPDSRLDDLLWYEATDSNLRFDQRTSAVECAGLITDPGLRYRAYAVVLKLLMHPPGSRSAALSFLADQAKLTPEQKTSLAKILTTPSAPRPPPDD